MSTYLVFQMQVILKKKLFCVDLCLKIYNNQSTEGIEPNTEIMCSVLMQGETVSGKYTGLYQGTE